MLARIQTDHILKHPQLQHSRKVGQNSFDRTVRLLPKALKVAFRGNILPDDRGVKVIVFLELREEGC
jgi:hypothetical protein